MLRYNFDAVSCESCKAFFRRNAFNVCNCPLWQFALLTTRVGKLHECTEGAMRDVQNPKCAHGGHCEINVASRRFCSSCRLVKCLANGMKREYIFRGTSALPFL